MHCCSTYSPCDFFLFSRLKLPLRGMRFGAIEAINENSLKELKAIPWMSLPEVRRGLGQSLEYVYCFKWRVFRRRQNLFIAYPNSRYIFDRVYVDATFKVCPRGMFKKPIIIFVQIHKQVKINTSFLDIVLSFLHNGFAILSFHRSFFDFRCWYHYVICRWFHWRIYGWSAKLRSLTGRFFNM